MSVRGNDVRIFCVCAYAFVRICCVCVLAYAFVRSCVGVFVFLRRCVCVCACVCVCVGICAYVRLRSCVVAFALLSVDCVIVLGGIKGFFIVGVVLIYPVFCSSRGDMPAGMRVGRVRM
ncbi:hypothetical protein ES703_121627 [subsurface metagenome]